MKTILILLALTGRFDPSSGTDISESERKISGQYGYCDCKGADENEGSFILLLEEDHTFKYRPASESANSTEISGSWRQEGKKILLENYPEGYRIPHRWTITRGYPCLKSRTGILFQRICRREDIKP